MQPVSIDTVRAAAARIDGLVHRTPLLTSRTLDEMLDATIVLKGEHLQVGGAFKIRGASNRIAALSDASAKPNGILAFSSGNHAQAVAIAARRASLAATILMPSDAPRSKLEATRGYGAKVITFDRFTDDRDELAAEVAEERHLELVPPYDDPDVISGQGTMALELAEQAGELDAVIVPVGGGGLISGVAAAMSGLQPGCRVIGIEPEAADDARRSLARGEIVSMPVPVTIADGQQAPVGSVTFPYIARLVERIELVTDDEIVSAMRFLFERLKTVVEPSGATALAGLVRHIDELGLRRGRVAVILSGGNIDADRFVELVGNRQRMR